VRCHVYPSEGASGRLSVRHVPWLYFVLDGSGVASCAICLLSLLPRSAQGPRDIVKHDPLHRPIARNTPRPLMA
jgi:hypothetical protein